MVSGLDVPSLNPIRLRGVPEGRGGELNPSIRQRTCIPPLVFLVMSRNACSTVSVFGAAISSSRSPWHQAGSRSSLGNVRIAVSLAGFLLASP